MPDRWPTLMIHYHAMAKLTGDWVKWNPEVHNTIIEIENMIQEKNAIELEKLKSKKW